MAAVPTEVLNDDVKELKVEIRENRSKIDLVKDEIQRVALAQAVMKTGLRDDLNKVALAQSEMRGEFRLVKLLLTIVIMGIAGSIWQFFKIDTRVNGVETRLDKVDSRLEKLETSIAKILEQTKPAMPAQAPKP